MDIPKGMLKENFGKALIALDIPREATEAGDMKHLDIVIRQLELERNYAYKCLSITFNGYNDIPDEIYEIDTIRNWCVKAVNRYPHLFYFLTEEIGMGRDTFIPCISDVESAFIGERKSPMEWLEAGVRDIEDLPVMEVQSLLPPHLFKMLKRATIKYGNKVGDPIGGLETVAYLEHHLQGEQE